MATALRKTPNSSKNGALNGGAMPAPPAMPPLPESAQQKQPQGGGALSSPGMPSQMAPGGPQGAVPQAPPAPTHNQTVTALRHFQACMQVERQWMDNPDLGKADMRDKFIDGYTKLVADRIATPVQVVTTLATVPDRPYDQRKWVIENYQRNIQARNMVLAQHAAAYAGQPPQPAPDPDDHLSTIASMMQAHYSPVNTTVH